MLIYCYSLWAYPLCKNSCKKLWIPTVEFKFGLKKEKKTASFNRCQAVFRPWTAFYYLYNKVKWKLIAVSDTLSPTWTNTSKRQQVGMRCDKCICKNTRELWFSGLESRFPYIYSLLCVNTSFPSVVICVFDHSSLILSQHCLSLTSESRFWRHRRSKMKCAWSFASSDSTGEPTIKALLCSVFIWVISPAICGKRPTLRKTGLFNENKNSSNQ